MKTILFVILLFSVAGLKAQLNRDSLDNANAKAISTDPDLIEKAGIAAADSSIRLLSDIRKDHRFFGYEQPNINARRLMLFSIFTNDVEGNPYQLPYGAFYGTTGLKGRKLRYLSTEGKFIKAQLLQESTGMIIATLYFEKKWFEFEK